MGQIIGIDASIFMYVWNKNPDFYQKSLAVLNQIENSNVKGVFSRIGLIEILTGPKKLKRLSLASYYKQKILSFPNLTIKDLNDDVVELASDLRAAYGLSMADAIHIATAIDAGAEKFVTNDKALKKVKEITIELLASRH